MSRTNVIPELTFTGRKHFLATQSMCKCMLWPNNKVNTKDIIFSVCGCRENKHLYIPSLLLDLTPTLPASPKEILDWLWHSQLLKAGRSFAPHTEISVSVARTSISQLMMMLMTIVTHQLSHSIVNITYLYQKRQGLHVAVRLFTKCWIL